MEVPLLKVWVLKGGWFYEGFNIIALYYSKENCAAAADAEDADNINKYDYIEYEQYEIK